MPSQFPVFGDVKAVLFDIDDTLLDFSACVRMTMISGFEKYHLPAYTPEMHTIFNQVNGSIWRQLERGEITFAELRATRWDRVFDALKISFDGPTFEKYFEENLFSSHVVIDGAREVLSALAPKCMLATASNGPYRQQITRLEATGLLPFFSCQFISEEVGYMKPDIRFFDHCLRGLRTVSPEDLLPQHILMVGDNLSSDMDGALQAGFRTCYFDRFNRGTDGRKPDCVIHSLPELTAHFLPS